MCRNIWTTAIENEIFNAFGRDHLHSGALLDEALTLSEYSLCEHYRLYTVKLEDILSDEVIDRFDSAVKEFCASSVDPGFEYIEGSSIKDYYLNVKLFLDKHQSDECSNRTLLYTVSIEFRANEEDPESVYGDEYAVFDYTFGSINYYQPIERGKIISEAKGNMSRTLSAEHVEYWLTQCIDNIPESELALQTMMETAFGSEEY